MFPADFDRNDASVFDWGLAPNESLLQTSARGVFPSPAAEIEPRLRPNRAPDQLASLGSSGFVGADSLRPGFQVGGQPGNQRPEINEYQPKRGNILEFNNFRMVILVNVGSPWSQSLRSLKDLKGPKVSCSLFKFIVRVDC